VTKLFWERACDLP